MAADSTLDSELLILFDRFPGAVNPGLSITSDPTASDEHNVASPAHRLGTKVALICKGDTGKAGMSILTYLKVGTQNASVAIAAKTLCVPDSATDPFIMTNDPDSCIGLETGLAAYALSAMTDNYYGWFWTGGVCPEEYVSGMGGNYATDGTVTAGRSLSAVDLTADAIGIGTILSAASVTQDALTDSTGGSADTTLADLLATQTQDTLTDSTGGSANTTLVPDSAVSVIAFPIPDMVQLADSDIVTTITPGFAGDILSVFWVQEDPVTTGSKACTLNFEIGTTDVTGGVIALTSAACTPLGATIEGTAITDTYTFSDTDTISVEGTSTTAFVEGSGTIYMIVSNAAVNDNFADIDAQLVKIKADIASIIAAGNDNVADLGAQLAKVKVDIAAMNTALAAMGTPIGVALAADV